VWLGALTLSRQRLSWGPITMYARCTICLPPFSWVWLRTVLRDTTYPSDHFLPPFEGAIYRSPPIDPLLQASFQNKWPLRSILLAEAIKKAILVRMACKLGMIMYPNLPANPHARGTISVRPREDFTSDGAGSGGFQITRNSCASPQDLPGFRNLMRLMHAARISEY